MSNLASTMITLLVNNPLLPLLDLSCLRLLSCGGSPQTPAVIAKAVACFGCEFFVSYGMTECCGKISMSLMPQSDEWWAQVEPEEVMDRVNTSGRPFLLMEVSRIRGPTTLQTFTQAPFWSKFWSRCARSYTPSSYKGFEHCKFNSTLACLILLKTSPVPLSF